MRGGCTSSASFAPGPGGCSLASRVLLRRGFPSLTTAIGARIGCAAARFGRLGDAVAPPPLPSAAAAPAAASARTLLPLRLLAPLRLEEGAREACRCSGKGMSGGGSGGGFLGWREGEREPALAEEGTTSS